MRIYHYTTIETLALILHNKTIRFSRLDTVDDPDEYGFEKDAHNPAKYTYVSCWTTNNKESIPQWVMYGNQKRGVRISLDSNLFEIEEKGRHKYIDDPQKPAFRTTIDNHINNNLHTTVDAELVTLIAIKYSYFVRNKLFHGETADGTFKVKSNNLDNEMKRLNSLLEVLVMELMENY